MSNIASDTFEDLVRQAGLGFLIDRHADTADAMADLRTLLDAADQRAQQRLGSSAPRLTPDTLVEEYHRNPHKVRAFLEVLPFVSADMLLMVWRILQGMEVEAMRMEYAARTTFKLNVTLCSPYDARTHEEYESTEIYDTAVLRRLGAFKTGKGPIFLGFLALNPVRS